MTDVRTDVSVVICAYTEARWQELREAVSSVQRQRLPPREIILVVDYNTLLLARARAEMSGVVVIENQDLPGLSGARNTGVSVSRGALVAFLDDDAVAEPDWLRLLAQACDSPDVLGCGGRIEPVWRAGNPGWFPEEFHWVVGCSYRGLPRARSVVRNLIGSSMCIRREVFAAVGGFSSDVGRIGKHPVGCEETELCLRAVRRWPGRSFLYEPAARVGHVVSGERIRWRYFCARCFFEGRSKARVTQLAGAHSGLASERSYAVSALPAGVARNVMWALAHHDVRGFARVGAIVAGLAITTSGYLTGVLRQWVSVQWVAVWKAHSGKHPSGRRVVVGETTVYSARFSISKGDRD